MLFFLAENMTSEQRKENYLCDITYVTNSELGFDYLRDNLATESNSSFTYFLHLIYALQIVNFYPFDIALNSKLWNVQSVEELVIRGFNYCIIDEVDSILIDEARTPLIISGPAEKPSDRYYKAAKIAEAFEQDIHYTVILLNYVYILKFNVVLSLSEYIFSIPFSVHAQLTF